MTVELFHIDPYCADFRAQVIDIGTDYVVLDQTYFVPESTEQACDQGSLDSYAVLGVVRVESEVRHIVEQRTATNLAAGDIVACQLDWGRRYRTMRLHTAQHLVSLALQATPSIGAPTCRAVDQYSASIDCSASQFGEVELAAVQSWVDAVISEKHLTIHETDSSLPGTWFWHIDGLAGFPCNGTHVRHTCEVGSVLLSLTRRVDDSIELRVELSAT